jgi:hypothetical protein
MKKLPDEQRLLEMLEVFKSAEIGAREICELSTAIAWKFQKLKSQQASVQETANSQKNPQ